MTSLAMEEEQSCSTCGTELGKYELNICDVCKTCPFCSSSFTVTNLNGIVVERRCHKCNAYTETYLDSI